MKEKHLFTAHDSYILGLAFTQDSQTMISCSMDRLIHLWSVSRWERLMTFEGHQNSVNSISLSPDETLLATSSTDNTVRLWAFPGGQLRDTLQDRKKVAAGVQISPDGKYVGAASYGGRAAVWTLDGEQVLGIKTGLKNITSLAFSPGMDAFATSGLGDEILVWSFPDGKPIAALKGHETAVGSLAFLAGEGRLVSLGYEGAIKFWDTSSWSESRSVRSGTPGVRGLCLAPDGKRAALSMESRVEIWGIDEWELEAELAISTKVASAMAFSPDGKWLAVGGADKKVRVFEM